VYAHRVENIDGKVLIVGQFSHLEKLQLQLRDVIESPTHGDVGESQSIQNVPHRLDLRERAFILVFVA
jgi:hypothetical protein